MTISECVRSSPGRGLVKSLELIGSGPVGLVHTQNFRLPIRKAHPGTISDTRLFSGEKRTSHFKRVKSVQDPLRTCRLRLSLWCLPTLMVRKSEVVRPARGQLHGRRYAGSRLRLVNFSAKV